MIVLKFRAHKFGMLTIFLIYFNSTVASKTFSLVVPVYFILLFKIGSAIKPFLSDIYLNIFWSYILWFFRWDLFFIENKIKNLYIYTTCSLLIFCGLNIFWNNKLINKKIVTSYRFYLDPTFEFHRILPRLV